LVIADIDEGYARGVANYISNSNPKDFNVNCLTNMTALKDFLQSHQPADIFLICPELYEALESSKAKLKLILSPGILQREYEECEIINKFQTGEKLLGSILFLYSKANPQELHTQNGEKNTRVVGIYSPSGGAGKTTTAVSLAVQSSEKGMPAFYLNLEPLQSTAAYFDCSSDKNMSYAFYYLKEKSSNLAFKLEALKSTDAATGVQYFNPPQSALEFDEIGIEEIESLVTALRNCGKHSFIFIEIPSIFSGETVKLMELCDSVVIVSLPDPAGRQKLKQLLMNFRKLSAAGKSTIDNKAVYVLNRCSGQAFDFADDEGNVSYGCRLPHIRDFSFMQCGRVSVQDRDFYCAVGELFNLVAGK